MNSARTVAAFLRYGVWSMPKLATVKVHPLLYYVQGHHLALTGRPAFSEQISAGDRGPVVSDLNDDPTLKHVPGTLTNWVMNAGGLVLSRYGRLTIGDLSRLTRSEAPWRNTERGRPIAHLLLGQFFQTDGAQEPLGPTPDRRQYREQLRTQISQEPADEPAAPDDLDELLAVVTGRQQPPNGAPKGSMA